MNLTKIPYFIVHTGWVDKTLRKSNGPASISFGYVAEEESLYRLMFITERTYMESPKVGVILVKFTENYYGDENRMEEKEYHNGHE